MSLFYLYFKFMRICFNIMNFISRIHMDLSFMKFPFNLSVHSDFERGPKEAENFLSFLVIRSLMVPLG